MRPPSRLSSRGLFLIRRMMTISTPIRRLRIVGRSMIVWYLRDEKGVLRMSLKRSDILYLQGSDNYVTVWYQAQNRVNKFMLRNTLRTMEDELKQEAVIRCHRSYLVNIEKVKLIRREKEGLTLELESIPPATVPVSRTYMHEVLTAFGHES